MQDEPEESSAGDPTDEIQDHALGISCNNLFVQEQFNDSLYQFTFAMPEDRRRGCLIEGLSVKVLKGIAQLRTISQLKTIA